MTLEVRCTVCERLTEPSPVPVASLRRWTEFGQCVALDLFMFAEITGQNGLFLNISGSIWEVTLNRPTVNWLSKLGADFCQRPQRRRP